MNRVQQPRTLLVLGLNAGNLVLFLKVATQRSAKGCLARFGPNICHLSRRDPRMRLRYCLPTVLPTVGVTAGNCRSELTIHSPPTGNS